MLLFALAAGGSGQGTSSRVTGTVLDQAGAAVPGATVTLTNEATRVFFTTNTRQCRLLVPVAAQVYKSDSALGIQPTSVLINGKNERGNLHEALF
jgi:hypothetical protein